MAITTLDSVSTGMKPTQEFCKQGTGTQVVGRYYSLAYAPGNPGAMSAPAGGIQGLGLKNNKAGSLNFVNPGSGETALSRFAAECINGGTLLLCDRLWENSGNSATSTGAQSSALAISAISVANPTQITCAAHGQAAGTFTVVITGSNSTPSINGTWIATYVDGTHFSLPVNVTNSGSAGNAYIGIPDGRDMKGNAVGSSGAPAEFGDGVNIAYEVSSTMGANTSTITANYTNSAGTSGKTTVSITMAATQITGAFIPLPLAAGDDGVRCVESHTKGTTQTSGTYHMIMYRTIARIGVPVAGAAYAIDYLTSGGARLYNDSTLFLVWMPATTTAPTLLSGSFGYTQG
jgi:hypothetical protein